jgi:prolyl-tRNA editing enzyme YbaK/EbsC (Cys-tRNA(Pro) deacylase)
MIGGVTPFALPTDIPLFIDENVMSLPRVVVGGGSRSGKILIQPQELMKIPTAEIVRGLAIVGLVSEQ